MNDIRKEFVIKMKMKDPSTSGGVIPISARHAALEKIAYDILELCGVLVPKSYLVYSDKSKDDIIGIATKKIEGINLLEELMKPEAKCSDPFQEIQKIFRTRSYQGKPIINFYPNLASFLFILDLDAIGQAFGNIVLRETKDGSAWEVVKIDPGDADLDGNWDDIFEGVEESPDITGFDSDLEGGCILRFVGRSNSDLTSRRFPDVFSGASVDEKIEGIQRVTSVTDKQLEYVIFNPCIPDTALSQAERKTIFQNLIKRRGFFQSFEDSLPSKPSKPFIREERLPSQQVAVRPVSDFEVADSQFQGGVSKPHVFVKRAKKPTEKESLRKLKADLSQACSAYIDWQENERPTKHPWRHHGKIGLKRAKTLKRIILNCTEINEVFQILFELLTRLEGFALWKHKGRLYEHSLDTYILRCLYQNDNAKLIMDPSNGLLPSPKTLDDISCRKTFRENICQALRENSSITDTSVDHSRNKLWGVSFVLGAGLVLLSLFVPPVGAALGIVGVILSKLQGGGAALNIALRTFALAISGGTLSTFVLEAGRYIAKQAKRFCCCIAEKLTGQASLSKTRKDDHVLPGGSSTRDIISSSGVPDTPRIALVSDNTHHDHPVRSASAPTLLGINTHNALTLPPTSPGVQLPRSRSCSSLKHQKM